MATSNLGDCTLLKKLRIQRFKSVYEQEIEFGSVNLLVGPNGSGKSTLLKTLARLLKPAAGTVLLDGKAIHTLSTSQVAQQTSLHGRQRDLTEQLRHSPPPAPPALSFSRPGEL